MTFIVYNSGASSPEDILLATLVLVLVVINVFGNTLVVLVILKDRSMRTPINYLLLNLATADMMVGVFSIPSTAFNNIIAHPSGLVGDFLCKFLTGMSLAWMAEMASAFFLMFIAVERYYVVIHPLDFQRKLTISKTKILVSVCWILSIVLSVPEFLTTVYNDGTFVCEMEWSNIWHAKAYALLWFTATGVMPVLVMLVLYSKVIRSLWFQRKPEHSTNFTRQAVLKSRKKISRIMLTVSVIYAITTLPNHICFIVENFSIWISPSLPQKVLKCLIVFNSAVNPFMYSLQSEKFNTSVKKLFDCNRKSRTGPTRGRENEIPRRKPKDCNDIQLVRVETREI